MYYVTHEMVAFKTRVIEKFKSESTVELCLCMKNPLHRYRESPDLFECDIRLFYCYAYVSASAENVELKRAWNQAHFI